MSVWKINQIPTFVCKMSPSTLFTSFTKQVIISQKSKNKDILQTTQQIDPNNLPAASNETCRMVEAIKAVRNLCWDTYVSLVLNDL